MADVYVDLSLTTGTNAGTSWANAYQAIAGMTSAAAAAAAGDSIWVQGTDTAASSNTDILFSNSTMANPVKVFGVKSTTTNEPPVQADLIPGWRTGQARTLANRAYKDADIPTITLTGGSDINWSGFAHLYALKWTVGDDMKPTGVVEISLTFEECWFDMTAANAVWSGKYTNGSGEATWRLLDCMLEFTNLSGGIQPKGGHLEFVRLELLTGATLTEFIEVQDQGTTRFFGGDLSDRAHVLVEVIQNMGQGIEFWSTHIHASSPLTAGTATEPYRVEAFGCDFGLTGKTSGQVLEYELSTNEGSVSVETTAFRTGGASDGDTPYSLAYTPLVDTTLEQYASLFGPLMYFKATKGTSKTVTVHIANSGAADYNDDDVWLEVWTPSEDGTSEATYETTQMDLLGTPSVIADDTGSTWGTGGSNHQKLVATVSPDYDGIAWCRVHFAKSFGSSPETLYVDPQPVYA